MIIRFKEFCLLQNLYYFSFIDLEVVYFLYVYKKKLYLVLIRETFIFYDFLLYFI